MMTPFTKWQRKSLLAPHHQHVQVPKMEVLNRIRFIRHYKAIFWVVSLTKALHTAYIDEHLHFRHLKCLVTTGKTGIDPQPLNFGNQFLKFRGELFEKKNMIIITTTKLSVKISEFFQLLGIKSLAGKKNTTSKTNTP